ncbi:MAG: YqaA family protein [Flavobacteriales bacterium]|jgi:membrane protein YqaA with SNARE-associated domain|nr:YqaA family protein [Flavobacteriales bacterium]
MDWLEYGYWGLFLAAFLSGTVVPFSSEVVLAGGLYAGMDPWPALIVATIGNWIGGYTTFWIGRMGKLDWIEKYFRVKHEKLLEWEHSVEKYGAYFAILGWLPILGNVILLALGFFRAHATNSAWWMLVGKTARYAAIIWLMN